MFSFLLSTVLALSLGSAEIESVPEQIQDTVDMYVIDDVVISDFDGSQLVGKNVSSYQVTRSKVKPVRVHVIVTKSPLSSDNQKLHSYNGYVKSLNLDGEAAEKKAAASDSGSIPADVSVDLSGMKVSSVDVIAVKDFEVKDKDVRMVVTKQSNIAYIIGDKIATKEELYKLDPSKISSMDVIKNKEIIAKYIKDDSIDVLIKVSLK